MEAVPATVCKGRRAAPYGNADRANQFINTIQTIHTKIGVWVIRNPLTARALLPCPSTLAAWGAAAPPAAAALLLVVLRCPLLLLLVLPLAPPAAAPAAGRWALSALC